MVPEGGDNTAARKFTTNTCGDFGQSRRLPDGGESPVRRRKALNYTIDLQAENIYFCISGFQSHSCQNIVTRPDWMGEVTITDESGRNEKDTKLEKKKVMGIKGNSQRRCLSSLLSAVCPKDV